MQNLRSKCNKNAAMTIDGCTPAAWKRPGWASSDTTKDVMKEEKRGKEQRRKEGREGSKGRQHLTHIIF
jgi:hypothetical protein